MNIISGEIHDVKKKLQTQSNTKEFLAELEELKCIEVQLMNLSKENIELYQLKTQVEYEVVQLIEARKLLQTETKQKECIEKPEYVLTERC